MDVNILIDSVQVRPYLYDLHLEKYKYKRYSKAVWDLIGTNIKTRSSGIYLYYCSKFLIIMILTLFQLPAKQSGPPYERRKGGSLMPQKLRNLAPVEHPTLSRNTIKH